MVTQYFYGLCNRKAVAALRLGFHSRYFGSDFLHESILVLKDRFSLASYFAILREIQSLCRVVRRNQRLPVGRTFSAQSRRRSLNGGLQVTDLGPLIDLVDNAFQVKDRLKPWLLLGARLGDLELLRIVTDDKSSNLDGALEVMRRLSARHKELNIANCAADDAAVSNPTVLREQNGACDRSTSLTANDHHSPIVLVIDSIVRRLWEAPGLVDDGPDERDIWIYNRLTHGVDYKAVLLDLAGTRWDRITTPQGLRDTADRFAIRHGLPSVPPRQTGRPRTKLQPRLLK